MKKILVSMVIIMSILCMSLTACARKDTVQVNDSLYIAYDIESSWMTNAINIYREKYPDVQITVLNNTNADGREQFFQKIQTEVLSGTGPDILFLDYFGIDREKMIRAGAFADMSTYFEQDEQFDIGNYNKSIFDGGKYDGKQYIIPLGYKIPFMLSTEKTLDDVGFDKSQCKDYFSLNQQLQQSMLKCEKDSTLPQYPFNITSLGLKDFWCHMNIDWMDYDSQKIEINSNQFKEASEIYKQMYEYGMPDMPLGDLSYDTFNNIKSGVAIFNNNLSSKFDLKIAKALHFVGENPQIVPIRNVKGNISAAINESLAVRGNSSNKQNAYNFIRIMLSDEVQGSNLAGEIMNLPISNKALQDFLSLEMNSSSFERIFGTAIDAKAFNTSKLTTEFCDEFVGYTNEIDDTYYSDAPQKMLRYELQPYLKDEKSYEECIQSAQDKLEIYISE